MATAEVPVNSPPGNCLSSSPAGEGEAKTPPHLQLSKQDTTPVTFVLQSSSAEPKNEYLPLTRKQAH